MKKRLHILFVAAFAMALVAAFAMIGCSSSSSGSASASASGSSAASSEAASSEAASSEAASSEAASSEAASSEASADAVELQIFAANSLEKALPEVQELYTAATGVTFADTQFKASGDLVTQLQADSDAADVLICASKGSMDKAEGLIDAATRIDMFVNDLVLCAKEGSDLKIADLNDLNTDAVKSFAMGEPSVVPAGDYAAQSLATSGLIEYDADAKEIKSWVSPEFEAKANTGADKVGTVASYVSGGQADVGFVYSSDIYRYDGIEAIYTVPADSHKAIVYPGAVTTDAKQPAAAADFLKFCVEDPEAQAVFAKYGFELA